MLGILRGHQGSNQDAFKSGMKESTSTQVPAGPSADGGPNQNEITNGSKEAATQSQLPMRSPIQLPIQSPSSSLANGLHIDKRQSFHRRAIGSINGSHGRFTNNFVHEQHSNSLRKCRQEFGSGVKNYVYDTSFEGLLGWIKSERLIRLPHKGGSWDRVLISAQYFAEQIHHFNNHIENFTEASLAATQLVYGQCLLLLELGQQNAEALEQAFNLFYQFGLELSPLLRRGEDLFTGSQAIMEGLGRAFADLIQIVTGVSITFHQMVHSGRQSTKVDIFATFSSAIAAFRAGVHKCSHEMWNDVLQRHFLDDGQVDVIQRWLAPHDSTLAFLSSNKINFACRPEQFTCEWFQSYLNTFLKGEKNILLVEGKAGSGKTTLANWTIDRLQRPVGRKHVSTISFFFDYGVAAQSTPVAMLRTLINQLLSNRIGNVQLFEAVNKAFMESQKVQNAEEQEEKLWKALSKALHAVSDEHKEPLIIVVDGITDADSFMQKTCKRLHDLVIEYDRVRLIQLSQLVKHEIASCTRLELSTAKLTEDLRTVVRRMLQDHHHFKNRDVGGQERLVEDIVTAADGSMLYSYLACRLLRVCDNFDETLKTVVAGSKTIPEIVKKLFIALNLDAESRKLLSILVTAERPLQLGEVEALLKADTKTFATIDNTTKFDSLLNKVSAFTVIGEGLIAIRHGAVRQAIIGLDVDAGFTQQLKNRQQDMFERSLVYIRSCLRNEDQPTFSYLDAARLEHRLGSHILLEYAVRYWLLHFKKSLFFKAKGDLQLPTELESIFPDSVTLCLLEQACWGGEYYAPETLENHHLAFRIRKALFGDHRSCVLQSVLICAVLCETTLSRQPEAIEWYALAARIASVVVGPQAELTVTCCEVLLRVSEPSVAKKRTTIMTYREEILLILVKSCTHRFGSSSKEVLDIHKRLHELYVSIDEETRANEIMITIEKLTRGVYGDHSDEANLISRKAEVLLKRHEHTEDIVTRDSFLLYGHTGEKEVAFTLEVVMQWLHLARSCVHRKDFSKAEEVYIELWLKLTEHCRSVHICEWHEKKIEVMIEYAEFLKVHKRLSEASALLVAIWTEYEHHEFSVTESINLLLKRVAVFMKDSKLSTTALLVFQKCWSYFHHHPEKHTGITKEIESQILDITRTTKTVTEKSSENVIRGLFEMSLTSSETITVATVNLCTSLATIYLQQERYLEAITCIEKLLARSWSSFFASSMESVVLAEHFSDESVALVLQLGECYLRVTKYQRAEEIYLRLYYAHLHHYQSMHNETVTKYREMLIVFYRKYEMYSKEISFYQELLVTYRSHKDFGPTHSITISILYRLGHLCRRHSSKFGYWLEYYLEIIANLNKGELICNHDALDALIVVAEHYYETLRFSESLLYFRSICKTFRVHGMKFHKYFESAEKVQIIVEQYIRAIEDCNLDVRAQVQIIKNLREACITNYGKSSKIVISLTQILAEICHRHEEFHVDAILLWEYLYDNKSNVSIEVVKRIKTSLNALYVEKASTTTVTTVELKKFTKLVHERYAEIRKEYACTDGTTLACLRELVMLYSKQTQIEVELAKKELRILLVECISKTVVAKELIETATFIARIYRECNFIEEGRKLIQQIKLQIIYKSTEKSPEFGFDLTGLGRVCFTFIATFEYNLQVARTIALNHYLSDLVAEYTFYQRFAQNIEKKAEFKTVLESGAWLRQILVRTGRLEYFSFIENKALEYFLLREPEVAKLCSKDSIKVFTNVLLAYYSKHIGRKNFVAAAGHAAANQVEVLLREQKQKEALELVTVTFRYLMAHGGLDDPTEITLGFRLCIMMAGRTNDKKMNHKPGDAVTAKGMMDLSRMILAEVFHICRNSKYTNEINLARCQLFELNALIALAGEQGDFQNLQWLLRLLWESREAQSTWSTDTILQLGRCLVQVQFAFGNTKDAVRLCENIVYNVRRVRGLRHHYTMEFRDLLASMYTSMAVDYSNESRQDGKKNKKYAEETARVYFKKAIQIHEEILKQIVNPDDAYTSDCDDDESDYPEIGFSRNFSGVNGDTKPGTIPGLVWRTPNQEIEFVRAHVRRLQLAIQRLGGWPKSRSEYENLTNRVRESYGNNPALKMGEQQVLASKWKTDGFGTGKAEGDLKEDGFKVPEHWSISTSSE
ncbi:hypothetical protein LTR05_008549 [Lithohypha guttulata]|uniref:Nephrocystin 3-like N-terminal domain-containing protein n=1 Tax=Lithohypha guttulata TaxID=1690604 RepID=A0AAN7SRY1_9EURO|nr:hypothetical protein LTR05_008549 [Lithohypha guttulata]